MKKFLLTAGFLAVVGLAGGVEASLRQYTRFISAEERAKIDGDDAEGCRKVVSAYKEYDGTELAGVWAKNALEAFLKKSTPVAASAAAVPVPSLLAPAAGGAGGPVVGGGAPVPAPALLAPAAGAGGPVVGGGGGVLPGAAAHVGDAEPAPAAAHVGGAGGPVVGGGAPVPALLLLVIL